MIRVMKSTDIESRMELKMKEIELNNYLLLSVILMFFYSLLIKYSKYHNKNWKLEKYSSLYLIYGLSFFAGLINFNVIMITCIYLFISGYLIEDTRYKLDTYEKEITQLKEKLNNKKLNNEP